MTAVPNSWLRGNIIYWPPNQLKTLQAIENSKFDLEWKPEACQILQEDIASLADAEKCISIYQHKSDSEFNEESEDGGSNQIKTRYNLKTDNVLPHAYKVGNYNLTLNQPSTSKFNILQHEILLNNKGDESSPFE